MMEELDFRSAYLRLLCDILDMIDWLSMYDGEIEASGILDKLKAATQAAEGLAIDGQINNFT